MGAKKFSTITFNIPQTRYWDGTAYAEEKKRQADVYVFCVLKHRDQKTINPLDLSQWAFMPSPPKNSTRLSEIRKLYA